MIAFINYIFTSLAPINHLAAIYWYINLFLYICIYVSNYYNSEQCAGEIAALQSMTVYDIMTRQIIARISLSAQTVLGRRPGVSGARYQTRNQTRYQTHVRH